MADKYVTDAGAGAADGSNLANAWSWATMLTTLAAGDRALYNGAIAGGAAAQSFTNAGTGAAPMKLVACDGSGNPIIPTRTAGGALDMTGCGLITYTSSGRLTLPAFFVLQGARMTAAVANPTLTVGAENVVRLCQIDATHATSASSAAISNGTASAIIDCDFTSTTTGGSSVVMSSGVIRNCLITAGNMAIGVTGTCTIVRCSIRDAVGGINNTAGTPYIDGCSFRNLSGNYINNGNTTQVSVTNCAAWGSGGASKWYNSTTSVRSHLQSHNAVGNMGAADTNEGDWPVESEVALSADPFTSSTNLTLNSTSGGGAACKGVGLHPYLDIGAWQVQASAGGGGVIGVIGG